MRTIYVPQTKKNVGMTALLIGLCAGLSGCGLFSDAPHYRGVAVTQHDLAELTPGIATQADAQALLGPPTFQEQFDANNWVYVAQVTKMRIANTEGVREQQVIVLNFDDHGVLHSVTKKGMDDSVRVAMDGAQTPVPGGHASFIQQLIGGVGSYNPLGATGASAGASAGGAGAGAGGLGGGAGDIGGAGGNGGF